MQGIDISGYQSGIDLSLVPCDFVWVKLTEGNGYVNPDATRQINQSLALGKPTGVYHYANGNQYEAEFFRQRMSPWLGRVAVGVDWETGGNNRWGDLTYLDGLVKRVKALTGLAQIPLYASEGVYPRDVAKRNNCPTWVAKYASMAPTGYQGAPWAEGSFQADIRQYASSGRLPGWGGNLDINKSYVTQDQWSSWTGNENDMALSQSDINAIASAVWLAKLPNNAVARDCIAPAVNNAFWMRDNGIPSVISKVDALQKSVNDQKTTIEALRTALDVVSKAVGANPDDIARSVADAVTAKLNTVTITMNAKEA